MGGQQAEQEEGALPAHAKPAPTFPFVHPPGRAPFLPLAGHLASRLSPPLTNPTRDGVQWDLGHLLGFHSP